MHPTHFSEWYSATLWPLIGGISPKGDHHDSLARWVEDRVLDFLDTYLQLETHPLYQRDNTVTDIVCGMRISSVSAASTVNHHGQTYYFCSEHCKEAFLERND